MAFGLTRSTPSIAGRAALQLGLNVLGFATPPSLPRGPCRIGFQAYSVHLAQFYRPLVEKLRERSAVEVVFVILPHPHFPLRTQRELRRYARSKLGIPDRNIRPYWRATWEPFDAMVCADVYASIPPRTKMSCYLNHGPGLTLRVASGSLFRKSILDFDLALVSGEHDLQLVRDLPDRPRSPVEALATGFPALDSLVRTSPSRATHLRGLGLDERRKTVLLAPSWRGLRAMEGCGGPYFDEIVAQIRRLDANLLVKLHACSLNRIMAGGFDWAAKLAALREESFVAVEGGVDDIPAILHSDVLVSDISSRAFSFMHLGKPVVACAPGFEGDDEWDRRRWDLIREGSAVAADPHEVGGLVKRALDGDIAVERARAVSARCFSEVGRSVAASVDALMARISTAEAPPAATAGAARLHDARGG